MELAAKQWCTEFQFAKTDRQEVALSTSMASSAGDSLPLYVRHRASQWSLTDRGQTFSAYPDSSEFELTENRFATLQSFIEDWGASLRGYVIEQDLDSAPTATDLGDFLQLLTVISAYPELRVESPRKTFKTRASEQIGDWLADPAMAVSNWSPSRDLDQTHQADLWLPTKDKDLGVAAFIVAGATAADRSGLVMRAYADWEVPDQRLLIVRKGAGGTKRLLTAAEQTGTRVFETGPEEIGAEFDRLRGKLAEFNVDLAASTS